MKKLFNYLVDLMYYNRMRRFRLRTRGEVDRRSSYSYPPHSYNDRQIASCG